MPHPKRGWYLVRRRISGVEILAGPYTGKRKTWQVYADLLGQHAFGAYFYGMGIEKMTAAEFDALGDRLIDRRKEFSRE